MPTSPPLPPLPPLPPSFGGRDDDDAPPPAAFPAAPSGDAGTRGSRSVNAPAAAPAPSPAPQNRPTGAATAPPTAATPVVASPARWALNRPGNPLPGTRPGAVAQPVRQRSASDVTPPLPRPNPVQPPVRPASVAPPREQPRPRAAARGRRLVIVAAGLAGLAFLTAVVLGVVFAVGMFGAATRPGGLFAGPAGVADGSAASGDDVVPALFDQTVTYDDGLQISVAEPEAFSPSPAASGADQPDNVAVTVTVYNGSTADLVPGTVTSVVSAGAAGSPIVDPGNGMSGLPPAAVVAPGETVTYVEAYSVADATDLVYVVTPAEAYLPARFTR